MAKYRVTSVKFCAKKRTHCIEFKMIVTGVNVDDKTNIVTFTSECDASASLALAQIYLKDYWIDEAKYFMGEYVDVPTPYGDIVRVFAIYDIDESGNKIYCPGHTPHELMCKYVVDNPDKYRSMQPV